MITYSNSKFYVDGVPLNKPHEGFTLLDACEKFVLNPLVFGRHPYSPRILLSLIEDKPRPVFGLVELDDDGNTSPVSEDTCYLYSHFCRLIFDSKPIPVLESIWVKLVDEPDGVSAWNIFMTFSGTESTANLCLPLAGFFKLGPTGFERVTSSKRLIRYTMRLMQDEQSKDAWYSAGLRALYGEGDIILERIIIRNIKWLIDKYDLGTLAKAQVAFMHLQ